MDDNSTCQQVQDHGKRIRSCLSAALHRLVQRLSAPWPVMVALLQCSSKQRAKAKKGYRILRKGKQKHAKGKSKGNSLILAKGKGFKTRSTEGHGSFSRRSPRSTQILVLGASCHTTGVASGIHPQHMLIVGRVDIWHRDCPKQKAD